MIKKIVGQCLNLLLMDPPTLFVTPGAVSSIPAMTAVFSLVKRPVFGSYIAFGLGGAIIAGTVFQILV